MERISDLASDLGTTTGTPLSGFGRPNTEVIHSLHIGLRVQRDGDSSPLAGLCMPFVSVNHPLFSDFNSEFSGVFEWVDVTSGRDCVELVPRERWLAAGREELIIVAGIGSRWEPGGALCTMGVPPEGTLSQ